MGDVMKFYLKTKVLSLAAEARIIRNLERSKARATKAARENNKLESAVYHESVRFGLWDHRCNVVRREARSSHIAYGFLLGRSYQQIENLSYVQPDWARVEQLITKYYEGDPRTIQQRYAEWKDTALRGVAEAKANPAQPHSVRNIDNNDWYAAQVCIPEEKLVPAS